MAVFHFELRNLPPEAEALRDEVRTFLRQTLGDRPAVRRARSWGGFEPAFSRKVGLCPAIIATSGGTSPPGCGRGPDPAPA